MKVRVYKNSLRIRLDDDDLAQLLGTGSVTEELRFGADPEACLIYSVEIRDTETEPSADFANGRIRVFIRKESASSLAADSEVCVEASQPIDGAMPLEILVEKEFLP